MPKGVIKTPEQEKKWKEAKTSAKESGQSGNWAYVMGVFKRMGGMSKIDGEDKNVLIERALSGQGKKTAIPHEAHQALHAWWTENKEKLLTPKQKQTLSDIKAPKERRAGTKLVKNQQYLNEMQAGLAAIRDQLLEGLSKARHKDRKKWVQWSQHPDHTPEELDKIQQLVDAGYHPREAAHLISPVGVGRGETRDFKRAMVSNIAPTMLSDKMLAELKQVARGRLEDYAKQAGTTAEPEKEPVKYAAHQMKTAHADKTADYHKAYTDFLSSDELKGKSPLERHKAVQSWKSNWKQQNPEYEKSLSEVANVGSKYKEAEEARKQHVAEIKHHIVYGGAPIESQIGEEDVESQAGDSAGDSAGDEAARLRASEEDAESQAGENDAESQAPMSAHSISEHMGLGGDDKDKDKGPKISAQQDPSNKFASAHKQYVESVLRPSTPLKSNHPALSQSPKAQALAAAAEPAPAAPAEPAKPKTVIRRMSPEQQDRLKGTNAAKMSMQTKKEPT